mgnify:CR=1 FL=1
MQITADIFGAYLNCPTKSFLRAHNEVGTGNAYADWVRTENEAYRSAGIKRLTGGAAPDECLTGLADTKDLKTAKWRLAVEVVAQTRNLESRIHAVERMPPEGRGKAAQLIPVRFTFRNKLARDDKLLITFDALVLSETLGRSVKIGKLIHGDDHATLKVKTQSLRSRVGKLSEQLAALLTADIPPDLMLNRHCGECEFRTWCRQKAVESVKNRSFIPPPTTIIERGKVAVLIKEKVWDRTEGRGKRSATHSSPAAMARISGFLTKADGVTRPVMM